MAKIDLLRESDLKWLQKKGDEAIAFNRDVAKMVQDYIRSRKALKCAVLAREIGWDRSSFHQWMTGIRKIPAEKLKKLETILINEYGMGGKEGGGKERRLKDVDLDLAEKLEKHFEILK